MSKKPEVKSLIVEGTVIVLSILLAFAIDAAWDSAQAARAEEELIVSVLEEVRSNTTSLRAVLDDSARQLESIDRFFTTDPGELTSMARAAANALAGWSGSPTGTLKTANIASP